MVLWSYCSTCSSNWWDGGTVWNLGSQTQFPNHVQWWSKRKIQLSPVKITSNLDSDPWDPAPNRPEVQNEQCLERGGLKMLHVAQNLAQQKWQRMVWQKVLSSVKQTAISNLSPHFKHVTNYPLSFQLLFDSDITDLPYTSRPGNSMESLMDENYESFNEAFSLPAQRQKAMSRYAS